jgi:hypothetical protein
MPTAHIDECFSVESSKLQAAEKASRCKARENGRAQAYFLSYVERGHRSATPQVGAFQRPVRSING